LKSTGNNLLVGAFSLGAVMILLGFAVFTGGFSSIGNKNERFVLVFHENMYGLYEGGKVTLNGVRIGRVERFFLGDEIEEGPVPVLIEINRKLVLRHMVEDGNEIFNEDGSFKNEIVPRLVGQLIQESFVTGILYVNLTTEVMDANDSFNDSELYGYRELKTKDSIFAELSESINFDKLSKQISNLMDVATGRLEDLNLKSFEQEFVETNEVVREFLKVFSSSYVDLGPSLLVTSGKAQEVFDELTILSKQVGTVVDPNSDFRFNFDSTLREVRAMAQSMKKLADLLEQNPQAILQGKNQKED